MANNILNNSPGNIDIAGLGVQTPTTTTLLSRLPSQDHVGQRTGVAEELPPCLQSHQEVGAFDQPEVLEAALVMRTFLHYSSSLWPEVQLGQYHPHFQGFRREG